MLHLLMPCPFYNMLVSTFMISVKVDEVYSYIINTLHFNICSFLEGVVDLRWHQLIALAQKGFGCGVLL